jgi:hypothetical protein
MHIGHAGLDIAPELELAGPFGDLDDAQFAGPVIDILEEMAVDRAQMGEVDGAGGDVLASTLNDERTLDLVQSPA